MQDCTACGVPAGPGPERADHARHGLATATPAAGPGLRAAPRGRDGAADARGHHRCARGRAAPGPATRRRGSMPAPVHRARHRGIARAGVEQTYTSPDGRERPVWGLPMLTAGIRSRSLRTEPRPIVHKPHMRSEGALCELCSTQVKSPVRPRPTCQGRRSFAASRATCPGAPSSLQPSPAATSIPRWLQRSLNWHAAPPPCQ